MLLDGSVDGRTSVADRQACGEFGHEEHRPAGAARSSQHEIRSSNVNPGATEGVHRVNPKILGAVGCVNTISWSREEGVCGASGPVNDVAPVCGPPRTDPAADVAAEPPPFREHGRELRGAWMPPGQEAAAEQGRWPARPLRPSGVRGLRPRGVCVWRGTCWATARLVPPGPRAHPHQEAGRHRGLPRWSTVGGSCGMDAAWQDATFLAAEPTQDGSPVAAVSGCGRVPQRVFERRRPRWHKTCGQARPMPDAQPVAPGPPRTIPSDEPPAGPADSDRRRSGKKLYVFWESTSEMVCDCWSTLLKQQQRMVSSSRRDGAAATPAGRHGTRARPARRGRGGPLRSEAPASTCEEERCSKARDAQKEKKGARPLPQGPATENARQGNQAGRRDRGS